MRFVLQIIVLPFLLYLRTLLRIRELSENEDATKAIFEFFRNLATALALVATGMWLINHSDNDQWFHTTLRTICGYSILLVAGSLHLLLLNNATHRLTKAGMSKMRAMTIVTVSIVLGIFGVVDYLTFK
ncbi:hypothetical protein [Burkholderia cenocepacia]|uniref:hypothetical protein n=1 Tax=Burkholderia cenocepacia TaxID=95486 RepID=UPI0009825F6D|nr:hypothetical protein [Burkholderia cenocepacia]AQQ20621.1 hypothetical protein A8D61_20215 [Burkholderia cenocepacia]ONN78438.1 hypothetical protein A8D62_36320 [Burkholderia cenocepacia]ONN82544.1 hypothetical protein A8D64_26215 [Burkholderia cenocepacia]ONN99133.1 hypothetical protein A8D67_32505 [Burkholderia cenocepacia]ONO07261.1 hypothetical protein A8D69_25380 [Burkholderia cenocepacia]